MSAEKSAEMTPPEAQPLPGTPEPMPRPTEPPAVVGKKRQRFPSPPSPDLGSSGGTVQRQLHLDRAVIFVVSHVTEEGVPRTHWKRFEWSADLEKMMRVIDDITKTARHESKRRGVEWHSMEFHIDRTDPECRVAFMSFEALELEPQRLLMLKCVWETIESGEVITCKGLSKEWMSGDDLRWVFKTVVEE